MKSIPTIAVNFFYLLILYMIDINKVMNQITNKPVYYGLIAMLLTFYGPRLHPKLPVEIVNLFNNNYFRFIIILLIIYTSNKDLQTAIMITIAFFLVMSLSNSCHCHNVLREKFGFNENFSDMNRLDQFFEEYKDHGDGGGNEDENMDEDDDDWDEDAPEAVESKSKKEDSDEDSSEAVESKSEKKDSNENSLDNYVNLAKEKFGGLVSNVKNQLEKYTQRPDLNENFENVNVDFTNPPSDETSENDGDGFFNFKSIESYENNRTLHENLENYENNISNVINKYKSL